MKRFLSYILLLVLALTSITGFVPFVQAKSTLYEFDTEPITCNRPSPTNSCPTGLNTVYQSLNEPCATDFADFKSDPVTKHYWVEDPTVTAQGKADERARQFLYWVLNTNAVDEAPVLRTIWTVSSTIALFGIVLIAAIFGIGYIISTRTNYDFKIRIRPSIMKIGLMLLYTVLSAALVFIFIQFSEVIMKFFLENLGGKDLFNIYFVHPTNTNLLGGTEASYQQFVGCRDLNIRVQEAASTEMFMLKLTNVSYYVLGSMLLLRKILLWFLLFVSPFLALLMPFILIRNTGWIWIGVFFQWLFYGPLVALFLGAMSKIWQKGIPFSFDFSRAGDFAAGYIYPTAINIVYGGPAQKVGAGRAIGAINNGNYIDTFAEYIITLIMLWAVTFFPWWLLRIFRDYCCDGIYAMKNILLSLYDHLRNPTPPPPGGGPPPSASPTMSKLKTDSKTPVDITTKVSLGSMAHMRKTATQDFAKSMHIQVNTLTDIARVETNKQLNKTVRQNLTYLANPAKAHQSNQRKQYMNLRSELFHRAIKNDTIARTILASTATSASEKSQMRKTLMQSMPRASAINQIVSQETSIPTQNIFHVTNTYIEQITNNNAIVESISHNAGVSKEHVVRILKSFTTHQSAPITRIAKAIARDTHTKEKEVTSVLKETYSLNSQSRMISTVALQQKTSRAVISRILSTVKSTTQPTESYTNMLARENNTSQKTTERIVSNAYESVSSDHTVIQGIAEKTSTQIPQVQQVITSYIKHASEPASVVIRHVADDTNLKEDNVARIVHQASQVIQTTPIIHTLMERHDMTQEQISNITAPPTKTAAQTLSQSQTTSIFHALAQDITIVKQLAANTHLSEHQVTQTLKSFALHINKPFTQILHTITTETQVTRAQTIKLLQSVARIMHSSSAVQNTIATQSHTSAHTVSQLAQGITHITQGAQERTTNIDKSSSERILKELITTAIHNESFVQQLALETNLQPQQITNAMNTYAQNIEKPQNTIISTINQTSGVAKEKIPAIFISFANKMSEARDIVAHVAQAEDMPEDQVSALMDTQMGLVSEPEAHVEKTITIPQNISLEDYEEVKQMWTKHYEAGEVPVSETIKTRKDWVEQEIVFITNTLNKLLSDDEGLQQEGLDELGFLLPIFLINNLSAEEILVYLKAKLEAAKTVLKILDTKNALRKEIIEDEEETLVDVKPTAIKGEKQPMHMELDEDKPAPQSIEDRVKSVQEKLASSSDANTSAVRGIKSILEDEAEK